MHRRTVSNILRYSGHFIAAGALIGLIFLATNIRKQDGGVVESSWLSSLLIGAAIGGAVLVAVGILLRYLPHNTPDAPPKEGA